MDTRGFYTSFALSYRKWHHRMTPKRWEHKDACTGLTALEYMNIFSLSMLLPMRSIPTWLFVAPPFLVAAILYWRNGRIYSAHAAPATYAQLSDDVPRLREFPLVYGYLFFTFALFVVCLYLAIQGAA